LPTVALFAVIHFGFVGTSACVSHFFFAPFQTLDATPLVFS
jgi:hypothetical protein